MVRSASCILQAVKL